MPFYDYECTKCGRHFMVKQAYEDFDRKQDGPRRPRCPRCKSTQVRVLFGMVQLQTSRKA